MDWPGMHTGLCCCLNADNELQATFTATNVRVAGNEGPFSVACGGSSVLSGCLACRACGLDGNCVFLGSDAGRCICDPGSPTQGDGCQCANGASCQHATLNALRFTGSFSANTNREQCQRCPVDTYSSQPSLPCTPCPDQLITNELEGQTECTEPGAISVGAAVVVTLVGVVAVFAPTMYFTWRWLGSLEPQA